MSAQFLFFVIDVVAAFSVALFGVHVLIANPKQFNARLLALICFNSVCAIVLSRQDFKFWIPAAYQIDVGLLRLPLHIARNLTPGVLMVLCHSLFQDEPKFPRFLTVLFALQITMESCMPWLVGANDQTQYDLLRAVPASLQLLFIGFAFYWLISSWQADLVEARRQLRRIFLVLIATFTFVSVLLERLLIPWSSVAGFYVQIAMSLLQIGLAVGALMTALQSANPAYVDPFRDEKKTPPPPALDTPRTENNESAVAVILNAFREQRLYRDGELTIASLAAKLLMPEYRLRKIIHEQMGYRNFNALLHEYRLAEACREFSDPSKDHLPILTIALTAGYNSINPFNRAFRDLKGMTPSAFRAEAQQKGLTAAGRSL